MTMLPQHGWHEAEGGQVCGSHTLALSLLIHSALSIAQLQDSQLWRSSSVPSSSDFNDK